MYPLVDLAIAHVFLRFYNANRYIVNVRGALFSSIPLKLGNAFLV